MLSPKPAFRVVMALNGVSAAPARAHDDFIRRRLRGRHAADRFDDRFRDLLSYGCVSASLGEPGDPTNDDVI